MENEMMAINRLAITKQSMDWEDAIRCAGNILLKTGSIEETYIDAMIKAVHTLGPYIVLAPGIAIAHAKAGAGVLRGDMGLLLCKKAITFGSHNDPVQLLFVLCETQPDRHIEGLSRLAELLCDEAKIDKMLSASSVEDLYEAIHS